MMHSNQLHKKVLIPFVIFLLLVFSLFFFKKQTFSLAATIASPVWNLVNRGVIERFSQSFSSKEKLVMANQKLQNEVTQLQVFKIDRDRLQSENTRLQNVLNRKGNRNLILAGILSKPPLSAYDTFVVDAGTSEGVKNGAKVFMYGNIAIGQVIEVAAHKSKLRLYSSPENNIDVFLGAGQIPIKVTGMGGGNFKAEVPRGVNVPVDTKVYFPGSNNDMLGVVGHIEQKQNDTFQEIYIKSPVDIWSLQYVEIESQK